MTLTELESASNLQLIDMHIMHISHEINIISILTPIMTLFDPVENLTKPLTDSDSS